MNEAKIYSYELNAEMLQMIREEFDVDKVTSRFAEAIKGKGPAEIDGEARAIFEAYGTNWIRRSAQLGEEYPDRTYEVLREIIDKTDGYYRFALLPQRSIEIAYLSVMEIPALPIVENNHNRLAYRIVDCPMYSKLREKCGDKTANLLPCRHACLTACKTIHGDLNIDANIGMEASAPKEGYCQFGAGRA